jgi:alpha-1,2-mannosyltransferase
MIDSVVAERAMPNNPEPVVGRKKFVKLLYYRAMVFAYRWLAGRLGINGPVACNSTWTRGHIVRAWAPAVSERDVRLLFPPVNVAHLRQIPVDRRLVKGFADDPRPIFISVGQFRPEKDHPLLLRAFARAMTQLRKAFPETKQQQHLPKLVIIGGARNDEDRARVDTLKKLVPTLGGGGIALGEDVEFRHDGQDCAGLPASRGRCYRRLRACATRAGPSIDCAFQRRGFRRKLPRHLLFGVIV